MKYPKFLQTGDTIGFVAPSFGCNMEPYKSAFGNAQGKLAARGYGLSLGPNCYAGEGIGISNTPEKCGAELTEYYLRDDKQCLISCGGGELMCETMSQVDFDALRQAKPKWYMGYSDNTNMTFLLTTLCDTASVYGPCAQNFGMEPWHPSIEDAMEILEGKRQELCGYGMWEKEKLKDEEHPLLPYNCTESLQIRAFLPTQRGMQEVEQLGMEGRLLGGCTDCLVNLLGTRFDGVKEFLEKYREDGFVWFLESCDLNVFAIRRAMWQMEEAGWFRYCKGFLIGRPLCFGQEMMGLDQYQAVLPTAERCRVPVLMDVDLGHLPPMLPLVTGSVGRISFKKNELYIKMDYC